MRNKLGILVALATALPSGLRAEETNHWAFDVSLYGVAAGMSGNITARGVSADWGSVQAGYRWLFTDYSQGSGANQFRYNILTQGPQVGFTLHF